MKKYIVPVSIMVSILLVSFWYSQKIKEQSDGIREQSIKMRERGFNPMRLLAQSGNWKEFVADDKSFKLLFPELPQNRPRKNAGPFDNLGGIYTSTLAGGSEVYSVAYFNLTAEMDEVERNARYEMVVNYYKDGSGSDYKTTAVYLNDYTGVEITGALAYGLDTVVRVFEIDQRIYIFTVAHPAQDELSSDTHEYYRENRDKFFNSFTLMDTTVSSAE